MVHSCLMRNNFTSLQDVQVFSSPMAVKGVEDKIRNAVQVRHARTSEYLKDFDRLRTGYMTRKRIFSKSVI